MLRFSLITRLYVLARFNQQMWEVVGGPRISPAAANVFAAMLLKSIAADLKNREIAARLNNIGREAFSEGSSSMDFDDNSWCGNGIFWPGPRPKFGDFTGGVDPFEIAFSPFAEQISAVELNPQPLPPRYLGAMISMLGEV